MNRKKTLIFLAACLLPVILSGCGKAKTPPAPVKAGLTAAVVAEHNTPDDCWMIVNNNIYIATDYILNFPAAENISDYCGKDATAFFDAREKSSTGKEFDATRQVLEQYYVSALSR